MTEQEKKRLQLQAEKYQMNMSDYIRRVAAKPPEVTKEEFNSSIQKTIYEIHKIGNNINQIAKKYNENNYIEPSEVLIQRLGEIYDLLYGLSEYLKKQNLFCDEFLTKLLFFYIFAFPIFSIHR